MRKAADPLGQNRLGSYPEVEDVGNLTYQGHKKQLSRIHRMGGKVMDPHQFNSRRTSGPKARPG